MGIASGKEVKKSIIYPAGQVNLSDLIGGISNISPTMTVYFHQYIAYSINWMVLEASKNSSSVNSSSLR